MSAWDSQSETEHSAGRPRTFFVDWHDLEAKMTAPASAQGGRGSRRSGRRRILRSVEAEVQPVRRNVKDAAEAVVTWVAAVLDNGQETNLNDVLDRCLRPGPDVERVNYAALAEQIRHPDVRHVFGLENAARAVVLRAEPDAVVITLSAGDGNQVGLHVLEQIEQIK